MPKDKSLFYYGPIYHRLFDPQLAEARQVAFNLIPDGSAVLDIGCGTGLFAFALREHKNCRVVGLDLSLRMLEFARKSNPFPDVIFTHDDATNLSSFANLSFDYATLLMLVHELSRPNQILALKEALRVAGRAVVIDAVAPLPVNAGGIGIRTVEATFGRDHNTNFKAFAALGGIDGILRDSELPINVEYRSVFWRKCREVLVVSLCR